MKRAWAECKSPFTPCGLAARAAALALVFLILQGAGWRDAASFLCGTYATPGEVSRWSALQGAVYVLSYLGAVVAAPILLLAALIQSLILRWLKR